MTRHDWRRLATCALLVLALLLWTYRATHAAEFDPAGQCDAGQELHGFCPGGDDGGQGRVEQETIDCLAVGSCGQPVAEPVPDEAVPAPSPMGAVPRFTG